MTQGPAFGIGECLKLLPITTLSVAAPQLFFRVKLPGTSGEDIITEDDSRTTAVGERNHINIGLPEHTFM